MTIKQIFEEKDGQTSSRRTVAVFCVVYSAFLSTIIIVYKEILNWFIFIPVGLFLVTSIVLWFFTTWFDIKELVSVILKKGKK